MKRHSARLSARLSARSPARSPTRLAARLSTFAFLGIASLCASAQQPVYRCGNTYSQTPCPQGKIVESTDVRSAAERAEAKRVAASERKLADDMRRDRLADEAATGNRGATNLGSTQTRPVEVASRAHPKPVKRVVKVVTKKRKKAAATAN